MGIKFRSTVSPQPFHESLRRAIRHCRRHLSIDQIAAMLGMSSDLLYKCLEWDERKRRPKATFPPWKLWRLCEVTGDYSLLECRDLGCVLVRVTPPQDARPNHGRVVALAHEFADLLHAYAAGRDPAGTGGEQFDAREAEALSTAAWSLMRETLELLEVARREAAPYKGNGRAATLADAEPEYAGSARHG